MSDLISIPLTSKIHGVLCHGAICVALLCLSLLLCMSPPLYAGEPPEIIVSGISGAALENVQAALVLPVDLSGSGEDASFSFEHFLRQSEGKARKALEPFGYYNASVTISSEVVGDQQRLTVKILAGEAVRLSSVEVSLSGSGREEKSLRRLLESFPLEPGNVLLQQEYEAAKARLKVRAEELGYLYADFSQHEIRINEAATFASIVLNLATGEKYYFGVTRIEGAPDYPQSFLRRHLTYQPGELFSSPRLGETQRNFTNSERFSEVLITPEKGDADGFRVPIAIKLKAAPRFSLRPGIGYGTDTGARFTVRYRDLNMFHLGHELYSQLYVAERLQGLVTGYLLPGAKDVRTSTTLQLNLQQEETITYRSRIMALELARNRTFGPGKIGTAYLKLQYEDYTVGVEESFSRLLLPGLRFSDDRYRNPIRPRRGFRYALDLRGTHQALGSDTALLQIIAEGSHLQPLPWRLSLHSRARVGTTLLSDPLRDIPPSLRFFAGGTQSVRGYSYQSLGPRDPSGQVVGGKELLSGSIELERAIGKDWGISTFYDLGNTFNSYAAMTLYQGAGVGLHYFTSVGALNLSVAAPLGNRDPAVHIHFSVGFEL